MKEEVYKSLDGKGQYKFENGICKGFFWEGIFLKEVSEIHYIGKTEQELQDHLKMTQHYKVEN